MRILRPRFVIGLLPVLLVSMMPGCDVLHGDPVSCPNSCQEGESRCGPGGGVSHCQGPNLDGCMEWATELPCPDGLSCSGGRCQCDDECATGDTSCAEGLQRGCAGPDVKGCYAWGEPEACPGGQTCIGNSCGCQDPCVLGTKDCHASGGVITCTGPTPEGCLYFGPPEPCPEHQTCQEGGVCGCEDPCKQDQMDCRPEIGITVCEGPDSSGCWSWGNPVTCPVGCACASEPSKANTMVCVAEGPEECAGTNQCCAVGQQLCMNDQKYRACKPDAAGCLIWDCSS